MGDSEKIEVVRIGWNDTGRGTLFRGGWFTCFEPRMNTDDDEEFVFYPERLFIIPVEFGEPLSHRFRVGGFDVLEDFDGLSETLSGFLYPVQIPVRVPQVAQSDPLSSSVPDLS